MEQAPAFSSGTATGGVDEPRTDVQQCAVVDDGIAVQCSANTMSAVEYLRSRNVGRAVIERVLLEPGLRRARQ